MTRKTGFTSQWFNEVAKRTGQQPQLSQLEPSQELEALQKEVDGLKAKLGAEVQRSKIWQHIAEHQCESCALKKPAD